MITEREIKFYETNGYLAIPLFHAEECNRWVRILKQYTDRDFTRQMNLDRKDEEIRQMVHDPRIYTLLESIYNKRVGYLATQILYKEPGSPFAKHAWNPHQDNFYVQAPNDQHCSATLILENSTPENGGVYFYPGSQAEPILEHERHPSDDPNQNPGGKILNIPNQYRRVDIWMKKGDLMIHHGNIIHGSSENKSNLGRYHFGISCVTEDATFSTEGKNSQRKYIPFRQ